MRLDARIMVCIVQLPVSAMRAFHNQPKAITVQFCVCVCVCARDRSSTLRCDVFRFDVRVGAQVLAQLSALPARWSLLARAPYYAARPAV